MQLAKTTGSVRVDYNKMVHALLNLLTNAHEAMPKGGTLTVGADDSGGEIRMWVRDTGVGISTEVLPDLFKLGFTTKTDEDHTGFGLWSVRRTVAYHGGRIEVESRPSEGSTFIITLPPAQEEPDA